MDAEKVAFLRRGIHRLYCVPSEVITEGRSKGRRRYHEDKGGTRGDANCLCHTLPIKVNGEVVA